VKKSQVAIGNAYEAVVNRRKGERREFFAILLGGRRSWDRPSPDRRVSGIADRRREVNAELAAAQRRHSDTCNLATCQCGAWDPETKRYAVQP
jgi:hypothetical protein